MKSVVFLFLVSISTSVFSEGSRSYQLELVQALFREGERVPDKSEAYKTDPYDLEQYAPRGYGQLTNIGMQREFKIGKLLRRHYKHFLGKYKSSKVYAYSTDHDMTKTSLQLVLAGLFPPPINSSWNKQLNWIPIPIHYQPTNSDFLQSSIKGSCGGKKVQELVENVPQIQDFMDDHKEFLKYLQNNTGINDTHIFTLCSIANNLQAIRSMNLTLPSWCSEKDFHILSVLLGLTWEALSMTEELRKMTSGPMVKQFLDNMKNHKPDDERKIYLYSGHDSNLGAFIGVHDFDAMTVVPDYGSTVIIEKLRGSDNESYVRMFLWTGVGEKLINLRMHNCDVECPLAEYEKIMTPVLPDPELVQCISRNLQCNEGTPSTATTPRSEIYLRLMMMMFLLLNIARKHR